jgi:hypothetical protein
MSSEPRIFHIDFEPNPVTRFEKEHPISITIPETRQTVRLTPVEAENIGHDLLEKAVEVEKRRANREHVLSIKNSAFQIYDAMDDYLKGNMSLDDAHVEIGVELEDLKKNFDELEVL